MTTPCPRLTFVTSLAGSTSQEMSLMPKVSRENVSKVTDLGVGEDRTEEMGGYTVNFVSVRQDHDLAAILSGLPGGRCPCPHWGYLLKGQMTVRYADHEEVITAG